MRVCIAAPAPSAWDALAVATRGGAAAFGLEAEIGTPGDRQMGRHVLRRYRAARRRSRSHDPIGAIGFLAAAATW